MILDNKRNTSLRLARTSAGLITLATVATTAIAIIAGPRLVLAGSSDNAGSSSASVASNNNATATATTGSASVNWNSDEDPFQSTSAPVFTSREPVKVHTRAVVTLRNSGRTITAPVEIHPRVEAEVHLADVRPRVVVAQGIPPVEPDEPSAPKGPKPPSAGHPKPAPGPEPEALPAPPERDRDALERRIDRLERMIEKLADERRDFHAEFSPDEWKARNFAYTDKDQVKWKDKELGALIDAGRYHQNQNADAHGNWPISEEQQKAIEKAMKDAQEEVARAMKGVELKAREAERNAQLQARIAHKDFARNAEADSRRKALELQKQAVERQMEEMNRQLEKLDQQMDRLDEQMDRLDEQTDIDNDDEDRRSEQQNDETSLPKLKEKR